MNRIYFVRHGENPANLTTEMSSLKVDYWLTPKGVLQAQQTGRYLVGKGIDEIYCSPLKRARETAKIIAGILDMPVVILENFREIQVGDLEGWADRKNAWEVHDRIFLDWLNGKPDEKFPNGEDYHRLWQRMRSGIEQVIAGKDGKKILIVAHGGIFNATLQDLCPGLNVMALFNKSLSPNCSISEVEIEPLNGKLTGRLISWGRADHLTGLAANQVLGVPADGTYFQAMTSKA